MTCTHDPDWCDVDTVCMICWDELHAELTRLRKEVTGSYDQGYTDGWAACAAEPDDRP